MANTHPYPEITQAIRALETDSTREEKQIAVVMLLQLQIRLTKGA